MKCPKCQHAMVRVQVHEIEIDKCSHCGGIWFDMLEHEDLKAIDGSEAVDTGDRSTGRSLNEVGDIHCPVCAAHMLRMVDVRQPHIWYEACPVCYGVFLDAGEFTDFKDETIVDLFKSLTAKRRD